MPVFDRLKKKCSPSLFFLAMSLFFLLLLLIRPRFSLHLEFRSVSGEGTLQVYQLNGDLREQNVSSQNAVLTPDTRQLDVAGYPLTCMPSGWISMTWNRWASKPFRSAWGEFRCTPTAPSGLNR